MVAVAIDGMAWHGDMAMLAGVGDNKASVLRPTAKQNIMQHATQHTFRANNRDAAEHLPRRCSCRGKADRPRTATCAVSLCCRRQFQAVFLRGTRARRRQRQDQYRLGECLNFGFGSCTSRGRVGGEILICHHVQGCKSNRIDCFTEPRPCSPRCVYVPCVSFARISRAVTGRSASL